MQASGIALVRAVAVGWQFMQRGLVSTLSSSIKSAAERFASSPIDEKLSGAARVFAAVGEAAQAAPEIVRTLISTAAEPSI